MNESNPPPPKPLTAADELLIQHVANHVLQAASNGRLPRIAWHAGLSAPERLASHRRWPLACALWEELGQRVPASNVAADATGLLAPLHALLTAQRACDEPALTVLANVLAPACFGSHHLWQDLGATGRAQVSHLMRLGFPALHGSNHRDLKWKRHLFLVLGTQLGRADLRPPKCDDCGDFDDCFGSTAPASTEPSKTWPLTPTH